MEEQPLLKRICTLTQHALELKYEQEWNKLMAQMEERAKLGYWSMSVQDLNPVCEKRLRENGFHLVPGKLVRTTIVWWGTEKDAHEEIQDIVFKFPRQHPLD